MRLRNSTPWFRVPPVALKNGSELLLIDEDTRDGWKRLGSGQRSGTSSGSASCATGSDANISITVSPRSGNALPRSLCHHVGGGTMSFCGCRLGGLDAWVVG
jgi:hypothetical protein